MTNETTKVMTEKEAWEWLNTYFLWDIASDWEVIYSSVSTVIYSWLLDDGVEVVWHSPLLNSLAPTDILTVNFYDNATSGTPYRTGTCNI